MGVLVTDGAAVAWLKIYLNGCDNSHERAFAAFGALVGAVGSIVASFAYLLGSTPMVYLPPSLASWSTIAMAVIIVIHFILVTLSSYKATSAQIDERTGELMSEATAEMLVLTEQEFRNNIPQLARQNSDELTRRLAGQFASLTAHKPSGRDFLPNSPQPSQNGKH